MSGHPDPERLLRPDPEAAAHLAACARCRIELRLWQDEPDEVLGPAGLRLLSALGEGPNGVVHLAVGPRGERLAVKRGARAPAGVPEHPNLGRARVVDGWLATEHVAGVPFDAGAFPPSPEGAARLAGALSQAASALRRLHERGIVHGNLRASNALVEPSGRVVLVDLAGTGRAGEDWHALARLAERANAPIGSAGLDEVAGLLRSDPSAATARLHQLVGAELRYVDLGEIGSGGMGEVRRVHDLLLGRIVAQKVLQSNRVDGEALARFRREAELTAQLQHPGIVPVYDLGLLPDGRPFYTMREVTGRTLADAIASVERGGVPRALVDVFARICDAVGYAHARGVVHGDLKPANVLLGDFGEVLVVDWGLSALVDLEGGAGTSAMAGTPAYLAPERARGERTVGPAADVWALGAVLYEILSGRPAYLGATAAEVLDRVAAGPPPPLDPSLPYDLVALCEAAMAREPSDRPPHAGALAASVREWLEGARRRDRALALVASADEELRVAAESREAARSHREAAAAALDGVKPHDPVSRKEAAWALEDAAEEDERRASAAEVTAVETLRAALAEAPGLEPARERLADHFVELHRAEPDPRRAAALEDAVRRYGTARHARWLAGDGRLSLETDPPGALVRAERIAERGRRLVVVGQSGLGVTPLREAALAPGSWILRIGPDVRLPVRILRGEAWSLRRPGEAGGYVIRLPERLDSDEVFVAGGWFASGGDRAAPNALPARAVWVEPFVMRRHPVTNAEYLAFLDDLVAGGFEEEALRHAPRERAASGGAGALIHQRRPDGGFALGPDADGDVWESDWPVVSVPLEAAMAYASWLAARSSLPWRLPFELEWEKAARGADARAFPWGNHVDPTWCCTRDSHGGRPRLARIGDYPSDESPYGVRGLGGNVRDRCLDLYRGGPAVDERGVALTEWRPGAGSRVLRGGSWGDSPAMARSAERSGVDPALRGGRIGFRLVRPAVSGA